MKLPRRVCDIRGALDGGDRSEMRALRDRQLRDHLRLLLVAEALCGW